MGTMQRFFAGLILKCAALVAPRGRRDEMVDEWKAELHRELRAGAGWSAVGSTFGAFADARALRSLGHEQSASADGLFGRWGADVRISLRSLARTPGFTAVAVLTLAIGLGSTSAIFTFIDHIVLDPLPYPEAERLVRIENQVPGVGPDERWSMSTAQQVFFTDNARTLEAVGLYRTEGGNVMTPSGPERARTVRVTASTVDLLGLRTELGRLITPADDDPAAAQVALVSRGFWQRALGGDAAAVGRTVLLDGNPIEIIGVLEPGVLLPGGRADTAPDIWLPLRIDRAGQFHNSHVFPGIGRLAPDATPADADAEFEQLTARLPDAFPNAYGVSFFERYGFRTTAAPLRQSVVGDMATTLWVLFGGVGLVLLVACANVTNLFLVRVEGRRRELSLRRALGADRAAIRRYVLSEGMVLAGLGGFTGLVVGFWAIPALTRLAPEGLPRIEGVSLGWETVLFALGTSLAVGLLVSAYPLLSRTHSVRDLVAGGRGSSTGPDRQRVRSSLVVAQMALAVALLVGAGLLVEGLGTLRAADPGFDADGVLAIDLYASPARYADDLALWQLHRTILERVQAIPGVQIAGMGEEVPVDGGYGCTVQGFENEMIYERLREAGMTTCAGQERVTPGYFEALGIPLLAGRYLEAGDNDDPRRGAVVVSKAFADRFWPGEDPLGQGVAPGGRTVPPWFRVVGVVDDVAKRVDAGVAPLSQSAMAIYYPGVNHPDVERWGWWWPGFMTLVLRTDGADDAAMFAAVRGAIGEIDAELPLADARRMGDVVEAATADVAFLSTLMLIAAAAALLLAAVGLYGVVSWVVARRTREIGMRLAIGADPATVVRSVVGGTMRLAAFGLVIGVPLALFTSRAARAVLVGVEPTSPGAYLAAVTAVGIVSTAAAWLPARRAAAIDPAESLRAE